MPDLNFDGAIDVDGLLYLKPDTLRDLATRIEAHGAASVRLLDTMAGDIIDYDVMSFDAEKWEDEGAQ